MSEVNADGVLLNPQEHLLQEVQNLTNSLMAAKPAGAEGDEAMEQQVTAPNGEPAGTVGGAPHMPAKAVEQKVEKKPRRKRGRAARTEEKETSVSTMGRADVEKTPEGQNMPQGGNHTKGPVSGAHNGKGDRKMANTNALGMVETRGLVAANIPLRMLTETGIFAELERMKFGLGGGTDPQVYYLSKREWVRRQGDNYLENEKTKG